MPRFDYPKAASHRPTLAAGDQLFTSAVSGAERDSATDAVVVVGRVGRQIRTCYEKLADMLERAGRRFDEVVQVVEYVAADAVDEYDDVVAARAATFRGHTPAVKTVVADRFGRPASLVEVQLTLGPAAGEAVPGSAEDRALALARASDGVVHLSTCLPFDRDGKLVGEGDLVAQTEQVFANAAAALEPLGLSMADVVKTVDFTTRATLRDYKGTGAVRRERLAAPYPGAAGILMPRLLRPGVLVQLDVTASRHPAEAVNPRWERYEKLTYSPAVKAGGTLFLSGQAALDPASERAVHEGDVVEQARYTWRNIVAVLEAAGCEPKDLVHVVNYLTPDAWARYGEVQDAVAELLGTARPTSAAIGCALLLRPEFQIEIDPLAVLPITQSPGAGS